MARTRKKTLRVPPELERALANMDRRVRYQLIRIANGLCANCGDEPLVTARLGAKCLKKQRERMHEKTSAKRRNLGARSYHLPEES